MTLFAKSGVRPALLCAVFVSLAASTALAGNPAPAHKGDGVKKHVGHQKTGYRPRHRIKTHPRNKNRATKSYSRGERTVRVIDTSTSTQRAPKSAFNAQRSGLVDGTFRRLERRFLRETIDAVELDNQSRRADLHFVRRNDGNVEIGGATPRYREIQYTPVSPTEGVLKEVVNDGPLRPKAGIIHVSHRQKVIGDERAAARARRFNRKTDLQYIRFYRDNEAYDVRFPSVVYLTSR